MAKKKTKSKKPGPRSKPSITVKDLSTAVVVTKQRSPRTKYTDPIKAYLHDIKDLPLLSLEEEKELSQRIAKGDKKARIKMIQANLRLVVSIAKKYNRLGLSFSDLIEEGNLGLMKGVERYDSRHGYRFSTYASWWIKQAIIRAIANQAKTIRIPVYMVEIINRLRKTTQRLTQKLGRRPTDFELSRSLKETVEKIRVIKSILQNPSSLNEPIGLNGTGQLINIVEDGESVSPLKKVSALVQHERIMNLLDKLTRREAEIVKLRFGLGKYEPHTLEETGRKFRITRERVRQIEASIIKKLKHYIIQEEKECETMQYQEGLKKQGGRHVKRRAKSKD